MTRALRGRELLGLMRHLVLGKGMFGAATARHLAAAGDDVALVGPDEPADPRSHEGVFGAHHDEGRIVSLLAADPLWIELVRASLAGMEELDPGLVRRCGVVTAMRPPAAAELLTTAELVAGWLGLPMDVLGPEERARELPALRFDDEEAVVLEREGGHFSPRRYVRAAVERASSLGAEVVRREARRLRLTASGVEVELQGGATVAGDAAVVATGAFTTAFPVLPVEPALRVKSETVLMGEVEDAPEDLPCVGRDLAGDALGELYCLPPIAYPDGRRYLKVGANTAHDAWLDGGDAIAAWYHGGDSDRDLAALREEAERLLPGVRVAGWHTRRCAEAYTAHGRPYVDVVEPGRLVVATGGNGRSAEIADAIGALAAELARDGDWSSPFPRDALRLVRAGEPWDGAELLRDRRAAAPPA